MKCCAACNYEFTDPLSPEQHRAHRDQHMAMFPRAGDGTREALNEMVAMAERSRKLATVKTLRDAQ